MTVQAGTELSLELLVGEFEEQACESAHHHDSKWLHDEGPATHHVQHFHQCDGPIGSVSARCSKAAEAIKAHASKLTQCGDCGEIGALSEFLIVLAPITH